MNHNCFSPIPANTRFPVLSSHESGMILRDHQHLLKLNQMAVEIHTSGSLEDLVGLVTEGLPITLDAEAASWSEHGPVVSMDRIHSDTSGHNAIIARILARIPSVYSHPPAIGSHPSEDCGANLGVYDVAALISSSRRPGAADFPGIAQQAQTRHEIVTQFCIDAHRGILITVQNSLPFTAEQKFTLSLLREHLAIAARRLYRSNLMVTNQCSENSHFSRREKEVLPYLAKGFTNPEIANSLGISPRTVEKHVASILDKSGLDNRRMLIGLGSFSGTATRPPENG